MTKLSELNHQQHQDNYESVLNWLQQLAKKSQEKGNLKFTQEVLKITDKIQEAWFLNIDLRVEIEQLKDVNKALEQAMTEEGYTVTITHKTLKQPVINANN